MSKDAVKIEGGRKLEDWFKKASSTKISVEAGYFATAKYPDGTPVPAVAVWHEFGVDMPGVAKIPARPTFRPAVAEMKKDLPGIIAKEFGDSDMPPVPKDSLPVLAERVGQVFVGKVQRNIAKLQTPALSEATLERRRKRHINRTKSTKPLVDTGTLRTAATYEVSEGDD